MATNDQASSSAVNQNGDTADPAGQTQTQVPTLESIQRDTATLFEALQDKVTLLEKQLKDKDGENKELQAKYMKLFLENKVTVRELQSLRATIETDADRDVPSRGNDVKGLRSDLNDPKDPAAGDGSAHIEDRVRFGGQHPVSDQSIPESHSSQEMEESNGHYSLQKRAGNAAAAAAAATVSQEIAYSSLKNESSQMIGASKNEEVTVGMLDWLAENISIRDWKPLLRKLEVRDGKIEDIIHANQGNIREQRFQGFKEWKGKTTGNKSTVSSLLSAMEKESLQQNIREFCHEFKVKRWAIGTDSAPQVFSCALHELTSPYLVGKFDELKNGLRHMHNLSELQCVKLQCPLTPDTVRKGIPVFIALEYCSKQILQKYPGDKEGRLLELQKVLQLCGTDVRAELKKFVSSGVVGPRDGEKDLRVSRADIISKVLEMLSVHYEGTKNWKDLTFWLKKEYEEVFKQVDKYKMDFWEKSSDPCKGARSILEVWMTTTKATEGKLYAWLVQNGRNDIAGFLE